jgi:purine-binding chemotaxis protein CheW
MGGGGVSVTQDSWLVCRAGRRLCALPIDQVIETMRVLPIEALPEAPTFVRGLSIIRGSPVPIVDIGALFGDLETLSTRLVAIRTAARTVALMVETVLGVRQMATGFASELPPLLRHAANEAVSAIGSLDTELLLFLTAARLVPDTLFDAPAVHGAVS